MPQKRRKLIFELTTTEKQDRFRTVLAEAINRAASLNQPVIYRNELCTQPNFFIHRYPNGQTLLIEQNIRNSEERTVRVIR